MLSKEERAKSKLEKKDQDFKRKHPAPWYKPFVWNSPVLEKVIDKKGREQVKVKTRGFYQMTYAPGTKIRSGERIYEVQKSGALKCVNKEPSKRDQHRQGMAHE